MFNDNQRNVIILALTNLVDEYSNALEDNQLNAEARVFMIEAINNSIDILNELLGEQNNTIKRPTWK